MYSISGPVSLTEEELQRLFDILPRGRDPRSLRDRLLVTIMGLEGLRPIELQRTNVGDIVRKDGIVGLTVSTKNRLRNLPLRPDHAQMIDLYLGALRDMGFPLSDEDPLFVKLRKGRRICVERLMANTIRSIARRNIDKLDLEGGKTVGPTLLLRRTAIVLALMNMPPIIAVMDHIGPRQIDSTLNRYTANFEERLACLRAKIIIINIWGS